MSHVMIVSGYGFRLTQLLDYKNLLFDLCWLVYKSWLAAIREEPDTQIVEFDDRFGSTAVIGIVCIF